jgi:hypothetical protein
MPTSNPNESPKPDRRDKETDPTPEPYPSKNWTSEFGDWESDQESVPEPVAATASPLSIVGLL